MENHSFSVEQAILFTQEGATLLQHHYFWHKKNKANGKNFHDGRYWSFNSASAFTEVFPYLSEKQIRSMHANFIECGILVRGNYNKYGFDRTQWFALTDFGVSLFENWNLQEAYTVLQNVKWVLLNVKSKSQKVKSMYLKGITIPVVKTDINTDNKTDSKEGEIEISPSPVSVSDFEKEKKEMQAKIEKLEKEKAELANEKLYLQNKSASAADKDIHSGGGGGGENSLENEVNAKEINWHHEGEAAQVVEEISVAEPKKPKKDPNTLYKSDVEAELPNLWPKLANMGGEGSYYDEGTNTWVKEKSEVVDAFKLWYDTRKKPLTKKAVKMLENDFFKCDPNISETDVVAILHRSFKNGWTGLFIDTYFADKAKIQKANSNKNNKLSSTFDNVPLNFLP